MNKMTLGNSLVDGKDLLRLFTAEEIADINASPISWAQCDDCDQWRAFPPEALSEKLPKQVSATSSSCYSDIQLTGMMSYTYCWCCIIYFSGIVV